MNQPTAAPISAPQLIDMTAIRSGMLQLARGIIRNPTGDPARKYVDNAILNYENRLRGVQSPSVLGIHTQDDLLRDFGQFLIRPISELVADLSEFEKDVCSQVSRDAAVKLAFQKDTRALSSPEASRIFSDYFGLIDDLVQRSKEIESEARNLKNRFCDDAGLIESTRKRGSDISRVLTKIRTTANHIRLLNDPANKGVMLRQLADLISKYIDPLHNINLGYPQVEVYETTHMWSVPKVSKVRDTLGRIISSMASAEDHSRRISISPLRSADDAITFGIGVSSPTLDFASFEESIGDVLRTLEPDFEISYQLMGDGEIAATLRVFPCTLEDMIDSLGELEQAKSPLQSERDFGSDPSVGDDIFFSVVITHAGGTHTPPKVELSGCDRMMAGGLALLLSDDD